MSQAFDLLLQKANENLKTFFGGGVKPLTKKEVKEVYSRDLLSVGTDAKTSKGQKINVLTGVLYLSPASLSGVNVCPKASEGCRAACLFTAGRGIMRPVFRARVLKTLAFFADRKRFEASLTKSIQKLEAKAKRKGFLPAVRLNGTSDLAFESIYPEIFKRFKSIQFYDYSKRIERFQKSRPENLDLTFSLSESNKKEAFQALNLGFRVAAVFSGEVLPSTFEGFPVIDGDSTDARFLDQGSVFVGLKAKGRAKKDQSGFVQNVSIDQKSIGQKAA
jgi:hypothetical protein